MKTSKRLEGIGEYYFSQKLREIDALNKAGKDILNLGIGSPDLPPHPEVIRTLQEAVGQPHVHAYQSYKGIPVLRHAMADWYRQWYGVELDPEAEVLPLIGSKEGIMHICMTYLDKGDRVWVPDPGYPTYRSAVKLAGGRPLSYPLLARNHYAPDFNKLRPIAGKVKMMFVNYPQMPTGQLPGRALMEDLVQFGKENDILIVHDNPYSFILNEQPMSMLAVKGAMDVVIELNSLSKSHNMAGWRVGMLCGPRERVEEVLRFKSNMDSGMLLPVQLAAAKALSLGKDWFDELNAVYSSRREKVFELLDLLGCQYERSQAGMFVWAAIPRPYKSGYALSDELLLQAGVFLTPGGIFGKAGEKYIRVSLCSPAGKLEEALRRVREKLKSTTNGQSSFP